MKVETLKDGNVTRKVGTLARQAAAMGCGGEATEAASTGALIGSNTHPPCMTLFSPESMPFVSSQPPNPV